MARHDVAARESGEHGGRYGDRRGGRHPAGLRTGRFDELHIVLVPIFLGEGRKLFENLVDGLPNGEQVQVIETEWAGHSDATYLVFRNTA